MPRGFNPYDEAWLQRRLWHPRLNRVQMWFDASDVSTIKYGATGVTQWSDKSGINWNATQATSANQPDYVSNVPLFKGRPALAPAGTKYLNVPSIAGQGWTAIEAFYVWANLNDPGSGTNVGPVLAGFGTSYDVSHEPYSDGSIYLSFCSTTRKNVGNPTPSLSTPRVTRIRSAASDWQYWLDGTQFYSTAINTVGLGGTPTIGMDPILGFQMQGYIAEILVFAFALSQREAALAEGFLAWKWGLTDNLPASHPFRNRPPLIGD